jgi:hypothetical protein
VSLAPLLSFAAVHWVVLLRSSILSTLLPNEEQGPCSTVRECLGERGMVTKVEIYDKTEKKKSSFVPKLFLLNQEASACWGLSL